MIVEIYFSFRRGLGRINVCTEDSWTSWTCISRKASLSPLSIKRYLYTLCIFFLFDKARFLVTCFFFFLLINHLLYRLICCSRAMKICFLSSLVSYLIIQNQVLLLFPEGMHYLPCILTRFPPIHLSKWFSYLLQRSY